MDARAVMMAQLLGVFTNGEGDAGKIFAGTESALAVARQFSIDSAAGRDFQDSITATLGEIQFLMFDLRSSFSRSGQDKSGSDRAALRACFLTLCAGAAELYGGVSAPDQVNVNRTFEMTKAMWEPSPLKATFSMECASVCGALLRGDYKREPNLDRRKLITVLAVMWHEAIHTVNQSFGDEMCADWNSGAYLPGGATFREGVTAFATMRDLKPMIKKLHLDKLADGLSSTTVPLVDYTPHTVWVGLMLRAIGQKPCAGADDFASSALRRSCADVSLSELGRRFALNRGAEHVAEFEANAVGLALAQPLVELAAEWASDHRLEGKAQIQLGRTLSAASIQSGDQVLAEFGFSSTVAKGLGPS